MTKLKIRGFRDAIETPCETFTELSDGTYMLRDKAGYLYPSHVLEGKLSFIIPYLRAGEIRELLLLDEPPIMEFRLIDTGSEVKLMRGFEHIASYRYREVRIPYVYPLNVNKNSSVTENSPSDHPHHHSLWTAHGNVNGIDFWAGEGRIRLLRFTRLISGPVYAEIAVENSWESEGSCFLLEDRRIRFWNTPSGEWLIDYDVLLKPKGETMLGDTKEAGMVSIRVANSMNVLSGGKIMNSWGGVNEKEVWGKKAEWCDYSGPLANRIYGVTIFDHYLNPRHPTYWHARDYGLMTANVFGLSEFTGHRAGDLLVTDPICFRYRLLIHRGWIHEAHIQLRYLNWIYPPEVVFD